jgi:5-hydroxyisourate hydrolase
MSAITTHILDTSRGCPAAGVAVTLEIQREGRWDKLADGATDDDGRCRTLLADGAALERATYRLRFATGAYQATHGATGFYPFVEVVFAVAEPGQHYHVPLLLSPFGYSTYRGS